STSVSLPMKAMRMSDESAVPDKNAVPVVPEKGRPPVHCRSVISVRVRVIRVRIWVRRRKPQPNSDRNASVRAWRRSKSHSPCHQSNYETFFLIHYFTSY